MKRLFAEERLVCTALHTKMQARGKALLFGTCRPAVNAGREIMSLHQAPQRRFFQRFGHVTFNSSNPSRNESTVMIAAMR